MVIDCIERTGLSSFRPGEELKLKRIAKAARG